MTPDDRRYSKSHEWVKIDGDLAIVGITDHAQDSLGDVTFVELPAKGDTLAKGGEFGVIESVKAASDLYSPVGGEIAEVNDVLEDAPELVNQSPYADGWLIKLKGFAAADFDELLTAREYEATID